MDESNLQHVQFATNNEEEVLVNNTKEHVEHVYARVGEDVLFLRYKMSDPVVTVAEPCQQPISNCTTQTTEPLFLHHSKEEDQFLHHSKEEDKNHIENILKNLLDSPNQSFELREEKPLKAQSEKCGFVPTGALITPLNRRKDFIEYLKNSGFISDLSHAFLTLFQEKKSPENVAEFMANSLGFGLLTNKEGNEAKEDIEKLTEELKEAEKEQRILLRCLDEFVPTSNKIEYVDPTNLPPLKLREDEGENVDNLALISSLSTKISKMELKASSSHNNDKLGKSEGTANSEIVTEIFKKERKCKKRAHKLIDEEEVEVEEDEENTENEDEE